MEFAIANTVQLLPFFTAGIACVASVSAAVSVGFSAGLKHFSLSECAKIGASAIKCETGVGGGGGSKKGAKKRKMPRTGGKTY